MKFRNLLKAFGTTALVLSLWMSHAALVLADEEEHNLCDDGDKTFEQIKEDFGGATILTEISEPLGGFEETLTSNGEQVVKVYWKYACEVENVDDEGKSTYEGQNRYIDYPGEGCPSGYACTTVQVIGGQTGTGILKTYIALIYRWAAGIVGIVAVLVIVISGIQISMDQGSGEAVGAAKTRILQSLGGLAILFLSALILYTINPTFFQQ